MLLEVIAHKLRSKVEEKLDNCNNTNSDAQIEDTTKISCKELVCLERRYSNEFSKHNFRTEQCDPRHYKYFLLNMNTLTGKINIGCELPIRSIEIRAKIK